MRSAPFPTGVIHSLFLEFQPLGSWVEDGGMRAADGQRLEELREVLV